MHAPVQRIVFFGTDAFSVPILQRLANIRAVSMILVCPADNLIKKNDFRFCPTKQFALTHEIPIQQVHANCSFDMTGFNLSGGEELGRFDVGVCASFGYKIPKRIRDLFRFGVMNVHPSMLPKYRGACPIQYAFLNGDIDTGISVQIINDKIDDGRLVFQKKSRRIFLSDTFLNFSQELALMGADAVEKIVLNLSSESQERVISTQTASLAPKIKPELAAITPFLKTAFENFCLWQALHGSSLSPFVNFQKKQVQVLDCVPTLHNSKDVSLPVNSISFCNVEKVIRIRCKDPTPQEVEQLPKRRFESNQSQIMLGIKSFQV